jgi:predicted O-methyltransferase YrrM
LSDDVEVPAPPQGRGRDDSGLRASRFHTARGPMPLSAWLRLPAVQLRARLGRVPERPWIVPAAIGWLARRMRRDWRVVELGSGRSTVWYAKRAGSVVSFEDNADWAARGREALRDAGLDNAEIRTAPVEEFTRELAGLDDASCDLLVVDFLESPQAERIDAVRVGREKVRPGGYLLLDDSDRPAYAGADEVLAGWKRRRFAGVKDEWPQAVETAIYRRPG